MLILKLFLSVPNFGILVVYKSSYKFISENLNIIFNLIKEQNNKYSDFLNSKITLLQVNFW